MHNEQKKLGATNEKLSNDVVRSYLNWSDRLYGSTRSYFHLAEPVRDGNVYKVAIGPLQAHGRTRNAIKKVHRMVHNMLINFLSSCFGRCDAETGAKHIQTHANICLSCRLF